jgi:hypothetical protein
MLSPFTHRWKASVNVLTVTQALTKRSKVIPGGGPYPVTGWEAKDAIQQLMDIDFCSIG